MFHFDCCSQKVDSDNVESNRNGIAMPFGKLAEIRGRHATEHALFVAVDFRFRSREVPRCSGLYLEDHEGVAIPRHQIKITT